MPHRINNGRTLIALTLMAAGALWLLIATGFVPRTLLSVLANWWPLFLVGAGLDLALPRRRPLRIPYTAIASITVIALALLGVTLHGPTHTTYQLHRSTETRAATVTLQLSSAPTTITHAGPGTLIHATFTGQPQGEITHQGERVHPQHDPTGTGTTTPNTPDAPDPTQLAAPDTNATIHLQPQRRASATILERGNWDIRLPPDLPLDLHVDARSGATTLDLNQLPLTTLAINAGSGSITASLPGLGAAYRTAITGGSGRTDLRIAPGASLDLDARLRSGDAAIHIGEGTDLRLTLRTGSGTTTLDLPDTAPIRIEIRDDGSGRLTLPAYLTRRSGTGDTGAWESSNLDRGGRVIEIHITDVGSGDITIR